MQQSGGTTPEVTTPTSATAAPMPSTTATSSTPSTQAIDLKAVSFQELLRQHRQTMMTLKDASEQTYRAAMSDAAASSGHLIRDINLDLRDIHTNEQQIETQIKDLAAQTEQFRKKMNAWGQMFVKFNQAVKELGDVENWSKCISEDANECLTILDDVSAKKRNILGLDKS